MRLLASRRVEAIVLIGSTFQTPSVEKNIRKYLKNLPIIIENGFIDLPNVYSVLADEQNGIAECLRLLYKKGRRRHPDRLCPRFGNQRSPVLMTDLSKAKPSFPQRKHLIVTQKASHPLPSGNRWDAFCANRDR